MGGSQMIYDEILKEMKTLKNKLISFGCNSDTDLEEFLEESLIEFNKKMENSNALEFLLVAYVRDRYINDMLSQKRSLKQLKKGVFAYE